MVSFMVHSTQNPFQSLFYFYFFHFPKDIHSFKDSRWTITQLMANWSKDHNFPSQRNNFTKVKMDLTVTAPQRHAGSPTFPPSSNTGWAVPAGSQGSTDTLQRGPFLAGGCTIGISHTIQLLGSSPDATEHIYPCSGLFPPVCKEFFSAQIFRKKFMKCLKVWLSNYRGIAMGHWGPQCVLLGWKEGTLVVHIFTTPFSCCKSTLP